MDKDEFMSILNERDMVLKTWHKWIDLEDFHLIINGMF